jgi:hypothetical protein
MGEAERKTLLGLRTLKARMRAIACAHSSEKTRENRCYKREKKKFAGGVGRGGERWRDTLVTFYVACCENVAVAGRGEKG